MKHVFTIIIAVLLFLPSSCSTKEDYVSRGNTYAHEGQYDKAIEEYNTAISINPNHADAYSNRGIAYGMKGQHDKAIEDFNTAISIDPNLAQAYFNRGVIYGIKGLYDK